MPLPRDAACHNCAHYDWRNGKCWLDEDFPKVADRVCSDHEWDAEFVDELEAHDEAA